MIRETRYLQTYPNKSVLKDVITREGPAKYEDFTPFDGMEHLIKEQIKGKASSKFVLADMFKHYTNRDLDPSRIKVSKSYGPLQEDARDLAGYVTLDDIVTVEGSKSKSVEDYFRNLLIGYKIDNKSPMRFATEQYTHVFVDDEDGEAIEERMLINKEYEDDVPNEEFVEIMAELPYLLKSIWSQSKLYKVNLFSLFLAYCDLVKRHNKKVITVTDFRDYNIYLIKKNGDFNRVAIHEDDNKYDTYRDAIAIFTNPGTHTMEVNLCKKYMYCMDRLGIDYRDENPLDYNNEFIESVICTYLPTNEQYFLEYKDVDAEIIVALKPENIFTMTKSRMYTPTESGHTIDFAKLEYFIMEHMYTLRNLGILPDDLLNEDREGTLQLISGIMSISAGKPVGVPKDMITFESSSLVYFNKKLLVLPGYYFGRFRGSTKYSIAFTKYGTVIPLENNYEEVFYLSKEDCLDAVERGLEGESIQEEAHWKCIGDSY